MNKKHFLFKNKEHSLNLLRKKTLSSHWIKNVFIVSCFFAFSSFFLFKTLRSFDFEKLTSYFQPNNNLEKEELPKSAYSLPLLVNLKGKEGPQLARVYVSIVFNNSSSEKEILSQNKKLEKKVLFLLSGQPIQALNTNKNHFEKQIQSQLNVFLSRKLIDGVHIKTEMLN